MTQYIPLDEVLKLLNEYPSSNTNKIIQALPEPINLTGIIDEMIEEIKGNLKKGTMSNLEFTDLVAQKYILEELKQRLLSNNN